MYLSFCVGIILLNTLSISIHFPAKNVNFIFLFLRQHKIKQNPSVHVHQVFYVDICVDTYVDNV